MDKELIFYINGCSVTHGSELFTVKHPNHGQGRSFANSSIEELLDKGYPEYADINRKESMGYKLSRLLDCDYIDNSLPGSSNDRIVRTSVIDLRRLRRQYPDKHIIAIIGWSSLIRVMGHGIGGFYNLIPFSENPNKRPYIKNTKLFKELNIQVEIKKDLHRYLGHMRTLQAFSDNLGVELFMFNSLGIESQIRDFCSPTFEQSQLNKDLIDVFIKPNYIHYKKESFSRDSRYDETLNSLLKHGVYGMVSDQGLELCRYGHPGIELHTKWAELMESVIKEHSVFYTA